MSMENSSLPEDNKLRNTIHFSTESAVRKVYAILLSLAANSSIDVARGCRGAGAPPGRGKIFGFYLANKFVSAPRGQ